MFIYDIKNCTSVDPKNYLRSQMDLNDSKPGSLSAQLLDRFKLLSRVFTTALAGMV